MRRIGQFYRVRGSNFNIICVRIEKGLKGDKADLVCSLTDNIAQMLIID